MANPIMMPKAGITVESCILTEWKVKVGDAVKVGDVLCTYETDKSSFDLSRADNSKSPTLNISQGRGI